MGLFRNNFSENVKLKICGVTRTEDILRCYQLGVDAVGFLVSNPNNEYPTDKLHPYEAKSLINIVPSTMSSVLLVKHRIQLDEIVELVEETMPNVLQIQEESVTPKNMKLLRDRYKNIEIIRTTHLKSEDTFDSIKKKIEPYLDVADAILLDSAKGGSGKKHNWEVSVKVVEFLKTKKIASVLAGGLHLYNVEEAIKQAKPDMVDIMSGARLEVPVRGVLNIQKVKGLTDLINRR